MEDIYIITLYDYYSELLTLKQKEYFEDYYFSNLSLQEIADLNDVSRNAVHKTITAIVDKLKFYEEKLKLYENRKRINELLKNKISDELLDKVNEIV